MEPETIWRRADQINIGDWIMFPVDCDFVKIRRIEHRGTPGPEEVVFLYFEGGFVGAYPWHEQIVQIPESM